MSTENIESQAIRELSESIPADFEINLPMISPDKWLDDTVEKTTNDIEWVNVNLSGLLSFVADMTE